MLTRPELELRGQSSHSRNHQEPRRNDSNPKWHQGAKAAALCSIWILLSFGEIFKYLHLSAGLAVCILFPLLSAVILWNLQGKTDCQQARRVAAVLIGGWLFAVAAYLVLHSVSQSHVLGPGSDRENALQLACKGLLSGNFPYSQLTFLHHPITPMPGALVFAIPFYLVHQTGLQNLFWLAIFFGWCYRFLGPNWITAWFAGMFVLLNPCIMQDFVTGGDFFTNFVYVTVIFSLVIRALTEQSMSWRAWVWPILLGIALSSRPIYSLLYPCLLAFGWQARSRWRALWTVGLVLITEAGVTFSVYLRDPTHFTPFQVGSNAYSLIPAVLHPALLTFAVGLAVASISFFVRLNVQRLYLILGAALTVVTLPLFVVDRIVNPDLFPLMNLIYLSPGLLLLAIWLVRSLERDAVSDEARV